jgi:oligopeptidase B
MGRRWYSGGRLLAKKNTFTDFVACAGHLAQAGWTSRQRLIARGSSAGGLLVGVLANLAPEAVARIVAEMPFVDPLTTILDPASPLTITEWEEWGNPLESAEAYAYIERYSKVFDNRMIAGRRVAAINNGSPGIIESSGQGILALRRTVALLSYYRINAVTDAGTRLPGSRGAG